MSKPRRALPVLLLGLFGLALAWKLIAEIIEPHFLLWSQPRGQVLQVPTVGGTSLRLYSDTRPYVGKIASLQKGLAWVAGKRLLIEEGYGFGCPIVEADGRAYVSRSAQVEIKSGVSNIVIRLPRDVGVRLCPGSLKARDYGKLQKQDGCYVNDLYKDAEVKLDVKLDVGLSDVNVK